MTTIHAGSTRVFSKISRHLASAIRTLRGRLKNVIRHARIGSRDAIEDVIERNLCPFRIAVLAGFDKAFRVTDYLAFDEDYLLSTSLIRGLAGQRFTLDDNLF